MQRENQSPRDYLHDAVSDFNAEMATEDEHQQIFSLPMAEENRKKKVELPQAQEEVESMPVPFQAAKYKAKTKNEFR